MLSGTDKQVIRERFIALRHNPEFSDRAIRRRIRGFAERLGGDESEINEILDRLFSK